MPISKVKSGSITDSAVTSAKIQDGSIVNADINACAAIASGKLTVDTSALETDINTNKFNISLLGFKMAVNEGLTVFNLVDGVVDEFNDESGTDEAEGSNDYYCATDDVYSNNQIAGCVSAGFTTTSVTEPDTSTAGTNPAQGTGTYGSFTVPTGMTSLNIFTWGAGGGGQGGSVSGSANCKAHGGGGGYATGTLAVTGSQTLTVVVGEGGNGTNSTSRALATYGGGLGGYRPSPFTPISQPNNQGGGGIFPSSVSPLTCTSGKGETGHGGGLAGIFTNSLDNGAPVAVVIAGAGGGGTYNFDRPDFSPQTSSDPGGAGGGLQGYALGNNAQTTSVNSFTSHPGNTTGTPHGGGGDQEQGGQGGIGAPSAAGGPNSKFGETGGLFFGGNNYVEEGDNYNVGGGAGAGYYGGGGGAWEPGISGTGGGGSSYYGHPQITCGSTEAGSHCEGGGIAIPSYVACTNEGGTLDADGQDGYVLLTGSYCAFAQPGGGSTTLVSTAFSANTVPTSARIVVFEEDVDTPTLNTDVIASVSRDGTNFTNVTLSDSGYVTGSSGQRILTGQADISDNHQVSL